MSRRERGYDDNLIVPPYEEVPAGMPGYIQEPQYINPHTTMIDQPIYYPAYRNNEDLIVENREPQFENSIGTSTHKPSTY